MSTLRRALGNTVVVLSSQVITWGATLVLTAALARSLGAARFGDLYLVMSFTLIFTVLVEFGLDQQFVRAIARDHSLTPNYLSSVLIIKTALWMAAYLLLIGIIYVLGYSPELRLAITVYGFILLCNGWASALGGVYRAMERASYPAVGNIVEKVFNCAIAVLLLNRGYGVVAMVAVFVLGAVANLIWQAARLRRVTTARLIIDVGAMRALIRGALPFLLYWVVGAIYYRIDVVVLSKLTDSTVVGWYGAAYRLFDTLGFLPNIVAGVIMYPILSRLSVRSRADLRLAVNKTFVILVVTGVPICTGLLLLAEPIIGLLYGGTDFGPSVAVLRWLAVGLGFMYINTLLATLLCSMNLERKLTALAILACVLNLGLNWLLIPRFQHLAAAAVTMGTELFLLAYLLVIVPKDLIARDNLLVLVKSAAAAVAMAAVLHALRGTNLLVLIPLGALVYMLAGLFLRVVPTEDLRLLSAALRMQRGGTVQQEAA